MADLYLASRSPRRRELLTQLGVSFEPLPLDVAETRAAGESPTAYVERLALDKARAGLHRTLDGQKRPVPVLGADTIGVCDDEVLEKPRDRDHALSMWRLLSGRSHEVMTAVAVCSRENETVCRVTTCVWFRLLDEGEMRAYWETGEPADKAGGYGIQGRGGVFVERIEGSYSAVVGLPLAETAELLNRFQVPWWGQGTGRERPAQGADA